ncbi:hypothetical protein [Bradyrhizobium retamae]|uniref:hypothetical protein n=1 Tax=Bradyrhizobium retamae TaxID=1300035 RepID=UPI000AD9744B|nr:hypothetical protein [Bradyrhizobium retamae]
MHIIAYGIKPGGRASTCRLCKLTKLSDSREYLNVELYIRFGADKDDNAAKMGRFTPSSCVSSADGAGLSTAISSY